MNRNLAAFGLLCLLWGLAWGVAKVGLGAVPPLQMAAWRYLLTASLLFFVSKDRAAPFRKGRCLRTLGVALLAVTGTYGPLFWGMQHMSSGLAGLVNMALVPVLLFVMATVTGEERPTWRHAVALTVGCVGLTALFWTRLEAAQTSVAGLGAIVAGTVSNCLGVTLSRKLLGSVRPLTLVMTQSAIGGLGLLAIALFLEPFSPATLTALATPRAFGSLLFLSVLATIVGYTIYLVLVREWGTVRASLYAFVSPIVALATGALLFGETLEKTELAGAALLMGAAMIALARPRNGPPVTV